MSPVPISGSIALGQPIPDSPYAVSVSLPTWRDNVGYEERDPRVLDRLQAGYPRFVFHPLCRRLFNLCLARWGRPDEACLVFPTSGSARRFAEWMARRAGAAVRTHALPCGDAQAAFFAIGSSAEAKAFWQHAGEGISPRLAERATEILGEGLAVGGPLSPGASLAEGGAKAAIRRRLSECLGSPTDDIFLFPCGMNAAFQFHRLLIAASPGRRSVQFGFPYVDTLKIQQKLGSGVLFLPRGDASDLAELQDAVGRERFAAVYTEFSSNPLLSTPDLEGLAAICRTQGIPLVVDDTVASCRNVDLSSVADLVWMSLTKYFSGVGDVTGGALAIHSRGPCAPALRRMLRAGYEDLLQEADAEALERNSRDFPERMARVNANAERLADHLQQHPRVERVYFPKFREAELYRRFQKAGGGYGGLLSLDLKDAAVRAPRFFDVLNLPKGPNLGMAYTLVCPYTILAHYDELEFAERCGVSRWLIRVSVGTEPIEELISRFDAALEA